MTVEEYLKLINGKEKSRTVICVDLCDFKASLKHKACSFFKKKTTRDVVAATSLVLFQYSLYLLMATNNPLRNNIDGLLSKIKNIDIHNFRAEDIQSTFSRNDPEMNQLYKDLELNQKAQDDMQRYLDNNQANLDQIDKNIRDINNGRYTGNDQIPNPSHQRIDVPYNQGVADMSDLEGLQDEGILPLREDVIRDKEGREYRIPVPGTGGPASMYNFGEKFAQGLWDVTGHIIVIGALTFVYHSVDLVSKLSFFICLFICLASFLAYIISSDEKAKSIAVKSILFFTAMMILRYITFQFINLEELKKGRRR